MLNQLDSWLQSDGPVALTIKEPMEPAAGADAVFFPPTFAPPEGSDDKPDYVIENGICLVDTIGSQANRLEPLFKRADLAQLVPQFQVKAGDRKIDILDTGHRAADAIVRFSDHWEALRKAFLAYRDRGEAQLLAKIAPTSLVFGVWDSRDTGAKVPRLIESTIRAFGVERLKRSAQYFSALEREEVVEMDLESLGQKALSGLGILDSPTGFAPGGVVARGGIVREALLNLVALRALGAESSDASVKLQKYILGLSLISFLAPAQLYLRQGCVLVASIDRPAAKRIVWRNGKREEFELREQEVLDFARSAAADFGVGPNVEAVFQPARVKATSDEKAAKKKSKGAAAAV
jgi:CRISPR-associated protein Csb1